MNFKRSVVSLTIGFAVFGLTYEPINQNGVKNERLLSGFGWGTSAYASGPCETTPGCTTWPSDPPLPPLDPPDYDPPVCSSSVDCDGGGGGGGGGGGSDPDPDDESETEMSPEDLTNVVEKLTKIKAYFNALLLEDGLSPALKELLTAKVRSIDNFISVLSTVIEQGHNMSTNEFIDALANAGTEVISLVIGATVTSATAAGMAAALGVTVLSLPQVILSLVVGMTATYIYDEYFRFDNEQDLINYLRSVLHGDWYIEYPEYDPITDPNNPDCELRAFFGVTPCIGYIEP